MRISYIGFAKHISHELPTGCQGIKFGFKQLCEKNDIVFGSFLENPDITLVEMNAIGNLSFNKENVIKTLDAIFSSKKVFILFDDPKQMKISIHQFTRYAQGNQLKLLGKFTEEYKDKFYSFMKKINNREFDFILPCYKVPDIHLPCKNIYNFDYSQFHKYQNFYIPNNKRRILSYSWKKTSSQKKDDIIYLKDMKELDCFKMLCENRVCYMEDYSSTQAPNEWVRNRYAQSFNAKALIVGLRNSYFGKEFDISLEEYQNMSDSAFEECVKTQRQKFISLTSSLDNESRRMREIFNESM